MAYEKLPMAVLFWVTFANSYGITFLFSFIGFMVVDLGGVKTRNEAGWLAGYISSAFFVGGAVSAIFWGWAADRYGRKPVIIVSLLSIIINSVLFGLSTSVYMALITRFLAGLLNGIVPVSKVMIPELTSGKDQAVGLSMLSAAWSLGLILGPAISGWTASIDAENEKMQGDNSTELNFSVERSEVSNPYLLPSIITSVLGLSALIAVVPFLPETLNKQRSIHKGGYAPVASVDNSEHVPRADKMGPQKRKKIFSKDFVICLSAYCILCFAQLFIDDVIPLWTVADRSRGGLHFGSTNTGTVLALGGAWLLISCLFVYPALTRCFKITSIFICCSFLSGVFVLVEPIVVNAIDPNDTVRLWVALVGLNGTRVTLNSFTFNSIFVLLNNTMSDETRGRANGITMSVASFFKVLGPGTGTALYAWSIQESDGDLFHNEPFDWHLTFIIAFLLMTSLALFGYLYLPRSLNPKHESGKEESLNPESELTKMTLA